MFFIFGIDTKLQAKVDLKILKNAMLVNSIIKVYQSYSNYFFISIIPLRRSYSIYIPQSDEYFATNYFGKGMPTEYLEICKNVEGKI